MQSTGQNGTQASHPVHPSTTTAISFGRFFFFVYFSGILGMSPRKSFNFRSLKTAIAPLLDADIIRGKGRRGRTGSDTGRRVPRTRIRGRAPELASAKRGSTA